ncbi:hypothetical protein ES703_108208 [subsurface metagenome]
MQTKHGNKDNTGDSNDMQPVNATEMGKSNQANQKYSQHNPLQPGADNSHVLGVMNVISTSRSHLLNPFYPYPAEKAVRLNQ